MKNFNHFLFLRIRSIIHYLLWHYGSSFFNIILVAEYPKSGATWFSQILSDYLELPHPRNNIPLPQKSILQGHRYYNANSKKMICVVRDGRDNMVSFYHHMYFGTGITSDAVKQKYRMEAPFTNFENVKENMPAYIEYMFTKFKAEGKVFTWSGFVNSYYNKPNIIFIKYEDMQQNTVAAIAELLTKLLNKTPDLEKLSASVKKFSFAEQTKRQKGNEQKGNFLRKGISGDWKNYFSREACEVFDKYAGDELIKLGYEENHNWYIG